MALAWQATAAQQPRAQDVTLRTGLVITRSTRIVQRVYDLRADSSLDSAIVIVRGSDITVDFNGAELRGSPVSSDPDAAAGVAIRVEGGRNVRIINARVRGYRVGLMAVGTHDLVLADNDMSYNWKPRLFSLVEHESLADWMSFHHNEHREWLRFGAGIYLEDVHGGELRGNRVEQGSNGVMLVRTDSLSIHDNSLSYNSAIGLGLYRSSWNRITHNQVDYNVRGYSHGFFRRGQDSAGLLLYEQSSHNVVSGNSVTHGGDGLFLWAGQSTMDTGQGGANDNLVTGNDFSFAPTNGMEATFSRNDFIGNRIEGSDYGLWGGYSFGSRVIGNCFMRNRVGVAIEHGQDDSIVGNHFDGDSTGVSIWANPIEPSDWGYPKHRDTRSRDYRIADNRFAAVANPLKIVNTTAADTSNNRIVSSVDNNCDPRALVPATFAHLLPARGEEFTTTPASRRDRSAIIVDEWGPFDWRSPTLWPIDSTHAIPLRLRVAGPPGSWRLVHREGIASISKTSGDVGDTIALSPDGHGPDWSIVLEYRGTATLTPRGERRGAGVPYQFSYGRFEPQMEWDVDFYRWPDTTAKTIAPATADSLRRSSPILARHEPRLDYMWYRPAIKSVPTDHYVVDAASVVELPSGPYTLRTISDDAIRVWVDGVLAIDHWTPHESAVDYAALASGRHAIRVAYAQVDGWSELRVEVVRGTQRSPGTAGPH